MPAKHKRTASASQQECMDSHTQEHRRARDGQACATQGGHACATVPTGGRWVTAGEAARLLGVHRNTIAAAIRRGELPATRIGSRYYIPTEAIERIGWEPCVTERTGDAR